MERNPINNNIQRDFHSLILKDLYSSNDGSLLLLSKGMGLYSLIAKFLIEKLDRLNLIFLLSFSDEEIMAISQEMKVISKGIHSGIFQITNEPSTKRTKMYLQGGVFGVSDVVLVFDILQSAVSPLIITGILLNNLHEIKDIYDRRSWICTLIRLESQKTFIIGINEELESAIRLETVMRACYFKKAFFWPICRLEVQKCLNPHAFLEKKAISNEKNDDINKLNENLDNKTIDINKDNITKDIINNNSPIIKDINQILEEPEVKIIRTIEIYVKPSILMRKIQDSLIIILQNLMNQLNNSLLKRSNGSIYGLLYDDLTCISQRSFYRKLINIKEKEPSVLNLIKDLWGFRSLLNALLNEECCYFYRKILIFRENAGFDSIWYLGDKNALDEIERLIKNAKKRIYELKNPKNNDNTNKIKIFTQENFLQDINLKPFTQETLLQDNSNAYLNSFTKEGVLQDFNIKSLPEESLVETTKSTKSNPNLTTNPNDKNELLSQKPLLFEFSLPQTLKLNLETSPKLEALRKTLLKLENAFPKPNIIWIHTTSEHKVKELHDFLNSVFVRKDCHFTPLARNLSYFLNNPSERVRRQSLCKNLSPDGPFNPQETEAIILEGCRQELDSLLMNLKELNILAQPQLDKTQYLDLYKSLLKQFFESKGLEKLDLKHLKIDEFDDKGFEIFPKNSIINGSEIIINSLKRPALVSSFLSRFQPDAIILLEPHLDLIRETIVQYHYNLKPIRLYVLMFQQSMESSLYLDSAKRENKLLDLVIKDWPGDNCFSETPANRIKLAERVISTRIPQRDKKPIIIVDKREFHSDLPSRLYHEGFLIIPRFLEKGDFILGEDLMVERKQVWTGDLFESLKGGRLEKQMKKAFETFRICCLLIEFEGGEFSFENVGKKDFFDRRPGLEKENVELENKGMKGSIVFMLAGIVVKFPKLVVLWSKNNEQSSRLFKILKKNQKEPDPNKFLPKGEEKEEEEFVGLYGKMKDEELEKEFI